MSSLFSFLKHLFSLIFGGLHIGAKTDNSQSNISGTKAKTITIGSGKSNTTINQTYNINLKLPEGITTAPPKAVSQKKALSNQAKSIMEQLIESGHDGLVTWKPNHVIIEGLQTTQNMDIVIDDMDSVDDDLTSLTHNGLLKYYKECDSGIGSIYYLTAAGKKYRKTSNTRDNLDDMIFRCIENHPGIQANALAEQLSISREIVKRHLHALMLKGVIVFQGSYKTGGYYLR